MTKVRLSNDILWLDLQVYEIHLVIDENLHREVSGGFETLGAISPTIEDVCDMFALTLGTILDATPGVGDSMKMYLEGLKGAIVNFHLLFTSSPR